MVRRCLRVQSALLLACLPLPGCCTLARFFCGPDTSPWVPIEYGSPRATLATFLEAVRRDDPDRVYQCLSAGYIARRDLDTMLVNAFWERLRADVPGLHMLGYAAIPDRPLREQDHGVTYAIEVEGRTLEIDLVRETYWHVRYHNPDGTQTTPGATLEGDTLNGAVQISPAGPDDKPDPDERPQSRITLARPLLVPHGGRETLRLDDVDEIKFGREWKIANFRAPQ